MKFKLTAKIMLPLLFLAVIAAVLLLNGTPLLSHLELLEEKALGLRMSHQRPSKSQDIVFVTIDRNSTAAWGRFPWGRDRHVELLRALTPTPEEKKKGIEGPSAIAFDLLFSYPDQNHDEAFKEALRESGNVVLAVGLDSELSSNEKIVLRAPSPPLRTGAASLGSVIITDSPEAKIIALPAKLRGVYAHDPECAVTLDSFEIAALKLRRKSDEEELKGDYLRIKNDIIPFYRPFAIRQGLKKKSRKNVRGAYLVNYRGDPKDVFTYYSFIDVAQGKIPKARFSGRIVMVMNTLDPNDRFMTTTGKLIYGGEIHGFAMKTLIEKDFIHPCSSNVTLLLIIILTIIALVLHLKIKSRSVAHLAVLMLLIIYAVVNDIVFNRFSLWLPLVSPLLGPLLISLAYMAMERHSLRKTLGSLLPESFLKKLDPMHCGPGLGGKPQWATVLFADIRGYTNLSETLPPVEVMNLLNEYHESVRKPIKDNGGETFDYQGDAYMVVFGAGGDMPDHAKRAVKAAIEIARLVEAQQKKNRELGKHSFEIGIGICTGEVAVGYVGSKERALPAAIGDSTNVAARVQGKSSEFKTPILMTATTWKELDESLPTRELPPVHLKGKREPLALYTLDWEKMGN
jgi:class 3 adenylate cyclase/CHASE2 domain-containing sensor protein